MGFRIKKYVGVVLLLFSLVSISSVNHNINPYAVYGDDNTNNFSDSVNSPLADPSQECFDTDNSGKRTEPISRVTVHCMAGHNTALGCNQFLAGRPNASTNYSVGSGATCNL